MCAVPWLRGRLPRHVRYTQVIKLKGTSAPLAQPVSSVGRRPRRCRPRPRSATTPLADGAGASRQAGLCKVLRYEH